MDQLNDLGTTDATAAAQVKVDRVITPPVKVIITPPVGRACSRAEDELKQFAGWLSLLQKVTDYLRNVTTLWASFVILAGFGSDLRPPDFWFSTALVFLNYRMQILTRKYVDDEVQDYASTTGRAQQRSKGCLSKTKMFQRHLYNKLSPRSFPLQRIMIMFVIIVKLGAAVYLGDNARVIKMVEPTTNQYGELYFRRLSRNKTYALILLYVLVSFECIIFLAGDFYYLGNVYGCRRLRRLSKKLGFGSSDVEPMRGFLMDSISSPDPGRDMVTYAVDLLASDSQEKQLLGVRIIKKFANDFPKDFSSKVLTNVGANSSTMKTLVEMIKKRGGLEEEEEEKDTSKELSEAIMVLSHLAKERENSLRIGTILGSMRAISALFDESNKTEEYYMFFVDVGLHIIEELALDQDECEKIGKAKDLLDKLVSLTEVAAESSIKEFDKTRDLGSSSRPRNIKGGTIELQISMQSTIKRNEISVSAQGRSLKVLKMLTTPRGASWTIFRREISETSLVVNIRDILSKTRDRELRKLGIDVLFNLAEEKHAKEHIGATPGVREALVNVLFSDEEEDLRLHAGKSIEQLALKSKGNCLRILRLSNLKERFKVALLMEKSVQLRLTIARVLLYLCTYGGPNHRVQALLHDTSEMVLKGIVDENADVQDVMVGIAAFGFKSITKLDEWIKLCHSAGTNNATLASKLQQALTRHKDEVSAKHPNICSSVIELALWMIKIDATNVNAFKEAGIREELKDILESTPEIEEALALLA